MSKPDISLFEYDGSLKVSALVFNYEEINELIQRLEVIACAWHNRKLKRDKEVAP